MLFNFFFSFPFGIYRQSRNHDRLVTDYIFEYNQRYIIILKKIKPNNTIFYNLNEDSLEIREWEKRHRRREKKATEDGKKRLQKKLNLEKRTPEKNYS